MASQERTASDFYRLAVIEDAGSSKVVAERNGALLPLADILSGEVQSLATDARDLKPLIARWGEVEPVLADAVAAAAARFETEGRDAAQAKFLPPVAAPDKLICVGVNYQDHIDEMNITIDLPYPYCFLKPAGNTLRGSGVTVTLPSNAEMFDWEAELAVVIGAPARNVSADDALAHVAGYANFNDLSARDRLATRSAVGVDWVFMKAHDGFAPMGPYLVPARFIPDPQNLPVQLSVNGEMKQDSSTAQMVFGVAAIIEHLSSIMTLEPGDVIATGTPAGTASGHSPVVWLKRGDEMIVEIGDLGRLVTPLN